MNSADSVTVQPQIPGTSANLKRKCISPIEDESVKATRRKTEAPTEIVDFSDCILLQILKHLDATSLYQLGLTCTRFNNLVQDQSFWQHIDGRSEPNTRPKIDFCWKNLRAKTKSFRLCGEQRSKVILSSKIFSSDKLSSLTVLALEHQCIKYCRLNEFPQSLQEISFRHSYIPKHSVFFKFSEKQMCNLRVLILDHCKWFEANSFTSLCKYQKLEILSLYMCNKLSEDEIANVSLAGHVGFKFLKVADLRFTGLGEVFIRSFYSKPSMQIIYFQCYGTTYASERYKRKLDIIYGSKIKDFSYISEDEENNTDQDWVKKRFKVKETIKYETQTIKDSTMVIYKRVQKVKVDTERPKTVLYKYPYDSCTCGFYSKPTISSTRNFEPPWNADTIKTKLEQEIAKQRENRADMKGGEIYFMLPNSFEICDKIIFDSCMMPDWCHVEASPSAPLHNRLLTRTPRNDFEISIVEHMDKHYLTPLNSGCDLRKTCCCLGSPLRGNAIVMRSSDEVSRGLEDRSSHEDELLTTVTNYIDNIKNSASEEEAQPVCLKIVRVILNSELENCEGVLDDKEFMDEICRLIYDFANSVQFDVFRVIEHHSCCFGDLRRHIRSHCDVRECLRFFFKNLLNSERRDFSSGQEQILEEDIDEPKSSYRFNKINFRSIVFGQSSRRPHIILEPLRGSGEGRVRIANLNVVSHNEVHKECLTMMKELSLRGYTHITDLTLMVLKDLDLRLLDVTGTNVTAEGVQQFILYNPQCWFIHETACVCRPSLHF